jgi:hypothetical protein
MQVNEIESFKEKKSKNSDVVAACSTHGRNKDASESFTGKHEGI